MVVTHTDPFFMLHDLDFQPGMILVQFLTELSQG